MIDIEVEKIGEIPVIHVSGRIDASTCDDLEDSLMELLDDGKTEIIVEMGGTEYISSAGLRVLMFVTKQLYDSGHFCLCNLSEHVVEIIEMAGFNTIMNIYDDLDAAISMIERD